MPDIIEKKFTFKIGADPEFNILLQQKKVHAERIIKHLFKEDCNNGEGKQIEGAGELGWDGCSSTAEIRPTPEYSPKQLTENIGKIIKTLADKGKLFDLSTLSLRGPVGGHIHLEKSPELRNMRETTANKMLKIEKSIATQLVSFCMPLFAGENKVNMQLRSNNGYGKINDWRDSDYTIEFRSPSAEWLTTPKVCEATIAYIGVIYNEILHQPLNIKRWKDILIKNETQMNLMQQITVSRYSKFLTILIQETKKAIRTFALYPIFKDECEYILHPKQVLRDKEKAGYDIVRGWNFSETKMPTKRQLFSKKQVLKNSENQDIETIGEAIDLSFNNDMNVETFVNELKKRIIAYGWKLKNSYFFFGLRRGIQDFIIANGNLRTVYDGGQIKTLQDVQALGVLLSRINDKFRQKLVINEVTGPRCIMVGIPYKMRSTNNIRPFIEKILQLEKGLDKHRVNYRELPNDIEHSLFWTTLSRDTDQQSILDRQTSARYQAGDFRSAAELRTIENQDNEETECATCNNLPAQCTC